MDGRGRPDLGRDFYEAQAYIAHLEGILHAIGAKQILGVWHFPQYQHEAPTLLLMPERWVIAQKDAARRLTRYEELLSMPVDDDCDSTSGNVLPDLDGQNLTD